MIGEIKYLLEDYQALHSDFQIENFIIGQEVDDWSKYKQALREIHSRYEQLVSFKEKLEIDDLIGGGPWFKRVAFTKKAKKIRDINDRKKRRSRAALVENIKETERELERFVDLATELKKQIPSWTPEKRKELEAKSWFNKARKMAAIDLFINGGRLSQQTFEMIIALPDKFRRAILLELSNKPNPNQMLEL